MTMSESGGDGGEAPTAAPKEDELQNKLDAAYNQLRTIDGKIAANRRPARTFDDETSAFARQRGGLKRRIEVNNEPAAVGNRRSFDGDGASGPKRRAYISFGGEAPAGGERRAAVGGRESRREDDYEDDPPVRPRTVASSVVMPAIDTKSRETAIEEIKSTSKKADVDRNRRMFSNLLVGTLQRFKKDEVKVKEVEKVQKDKQLEVERRLENEKEKQRENAIKQRKDLLLKRRKVEQTIQQLRRRKAIGQYADAKIEHFRLLQNFIQTETKPTVFYLPKKHTLRTLELLKNTQNNAEQLIEARRAQRDQELANVGDVNLDDLENEVAGADAGEQEDEAKDGNRRKATQILLDNDDLDEDDDVGGGGDEERGSSDEDESAAGTNRTRRVQLVEQ